jgi:hypothetical protein
MDDETRRKIGEARNLLRVAPLPPKYRQALEGLAEVVASLANRIEALERQDGEG